jgi:hypothetical protein
MRLTAARRLRSRPLGQRGGTRVGRSFLISLGRQFVRPTSDSCSAQSIRVGWPGIERHTRGLAEFAHSLFAVGRGDWTTTAKQHTTHHTRGVSTQVRRDAAEPVDTAGTWGWIHVGGVARDGRGAPAHAAARCASAFNGGGEKVEQRPRATTEGRDAAAGATNRAGHMSNTHTRSGVVVGGRWMPRHTVARPPACVLETDGRRLDDRRTGRTTGVTSGAAKDLYTTGMYLLTCVICFLFPPFLLS